MGDRMTQAFKYQVMRGEWIAEVGNIDDIGSPSSFRAYWRSEPFPDREQAVEALEAHEDVIEYSSQLMRYKMRKSYTRGKYRFKWTMVEEYEK